MREGYWVRKYGMKVVTEGVDSTWQTLKKI